MTEKFTVGLVQMHCSPEPDDNIERAAAHVCEAAKRGATVICLPVRIQHHARNAQLVRLRAKRSPFAHLHRLPYYHYADMTSAENLQGGIE